MEPQIIRLQAFEVVPHHNILKQIQSNQKKQVYQAFDQKNPIIIQYGSQTTKVGYECLKGPSLVFRPQVSKTRDPNKGQLPIKTVMNLSYDQLDFSKSNFKSPFQKNIILHFSILQQCNDYVFSEILRSGRRTQSSLIISQPFANPIHCRASIIGQLFQCYGVNQILVGVDALFAYFYELGCDMNRYCRQTATVINMGANTIHVFCVIEGKIQYHSIRRINVGGNNAFQLFSRTLLLKNPQLKNKLAYSFLRDIYQKYSQVAFDYIRQLRYFQTKITGKKSIRQPNNSNIYQNLIHEENKQLQQSCPFIQMVEIDFDVIVEIPEEEIRRKEEMKIRMAEKLRETIERRKELKKKMHQHQLKQLEQLKQKYQNGDKEAHQEVVEMFGTSKFFDKLNKKIHSLQVKLGIAQQKQEQNKFSLIDTPDHELTSQKLKLKRIQIYQKNMIQTKKRKQEEKMIQQQKMKDLRENNPQIYLQQLKEKYKTLSQKAKQNERIKNELNSRKSRLKQKRMQVLARLAEQDYDQNNVENEEDIQALKDPEESDHYSQLEVMQAELRQIDPEWNSIKKDIHHLNSSNQLFMNVELIKCHQIYFEPRIIGCQQAGLIQAILGSMEQFAPQTKAQLLKNIMVVGGGSVVPGLKQRIQKQLTKQCPVQSQIKVSIGKGGYLGAYLGMQQVMRLPKKQISQYFYQRGQFDQIQATKFVENPWSNPKPNIM